MLDISFKSVILRVNLSQPRQGFRHPSGIQGQLFIGQGVISGKSFVAVCFDSSC